MDSKYRQTLIDRCDFFYYSRMIFRERKGAHRQAQKYLDECGLTPFHVGHILSLYRAGSNGMTLKELSEAAVCDKSNTSRVVRDLENKRMLVRLKQDAEQKKYCVALTDSGLFIAERIAESVRDFTRQVVKNLDDNELEMFIALFEKMIGNTPR